MPTQVKKKKKKMILIRLNLFSPSPLGHPQHAQYFIHPQWTVCLGAPKLGCKSTRTTGAIYLVDIGIPRKIWEQAGIDMSNIFWEAETLVNLTYDAT